MNDSPIVVVGAGLAGLTAANFLHQHGKKVLVFEASPNIAGLARSEKDEQGFTYDSGAHFITNRLAAAIGCSAICRDMVRYGETVWYRDRRYSYPLGLLSSPGFVASALHSKITGFLHPLGVTAVESYRSKYGRRIADRIAVPLSEAWSGIPGDQLSASVTEKFSTGLLRTIGLIAAKRWTGRTIGIGYSSTYPENPHVWHVYPEGGIGAICERLATNIQDCIHTNSPVSEIVVENEKVVGVVVGERSIAASAVISTAPVHVLPKLIRGSHQLDYLSRFKYRAMVFVNMRFSTPCQMPDVVTWLPERKFFMFRVSDIGAGFPWLVPPGKAQLTCDIGCRIGDEVWNASPESLASRCLEGLEQIVPGLSNRYLGCRVVKAGLAYPIFDKEYEADRQKFLRGTGIQGLFSVGRNGEFCHNLMEDVFWRTRRKLSPLIVA